MALQHESSVPLYIQIKERLHSQILSGQYPVGTRLPSERELAQHYNVSRMTARQALQALAHEGHTVSRVGKGTFVSTPRIDQELHALTSFSEDMRQRGLQPGSQVLRAELRPAENDIAQYLKIAPGTAVHVLSRVRLAGDQPLALETTHIPQHLCPGLFERYDFNQVSLYETLRTEYGHSLAWADQTIQTRMPHKRECDVLDLDRHVPVLSLTRVTFDDRDRPIEFVRSICRGDQYQLRVVLHLSEHRVGDPDANANP